MLNKKYILLAILLFVYYFMNKKRLIPIHQSEIITYIPNKNKFTVKTATYNVFGRWYNLIGNEGQTERLRAIPKAIYEDTLLGKDVDIITINELWCPDSQYGRIVCGNDISGKILIEEMAKYGWKYHTNVLCSLGNPFIKKMTGGGCIIFSKWEISSIKKYIYKNACGLDKCASKGIIYARILKILDNGKVQPINVFTTHLQAGFTDKDEIIREMQLDEIRKEFLESIDIPTNNSEIVLYQGDFNTNDKEMLEHRLEAKIPSQIGDEFLYSFDPTTNVLVGKDGTADDFRCGDIYRKTLNCPCCPKLMIDYILYSINPAFLQPTYSNMQVVPLMSRDEIVYNIDFSRVNKKNNFKIGNKNTLSDHYPVVANLTFN